MIYSFVSSLSFEQFNEHTALCDVAINYRTNEMIGLKEQKTL